MYQDGLTPPESDHDCIFSPSSKSQRRLFPTPHHQRPKSVKALELLGVDVFLAGTMDEADIARFEKMGLGGLQILLDERGRDSGARLFRGSSRLSGELTIGNLVVRR